MCNYVLVECTGRSCGNSGVLQSVTQSKRAAVGSQARPCQTMPEQWSKAERRCRHREEETLGRQGNKLRLSQLRDSGSRGSLDWAGAGERGRDEFKGNQAPSLS